MEYEIFEITRKSEPGEKEQKLAKYLKEKAALDKKYGLKVQVEESEKQLVNLERGRLITTLPLSKAELTIWRAWLLTHYSDADTKGDKESLRDYALDSIPLPVLMAFEQHKESKLFDSLEIWKPEFGQTDQILIGVIGNDRFLLARWAKSSADLISFDEIKRRVTDRYFFSGQGILKLITVALLTFCWSLLFMMAVDMAVDATLPIDSTLASAILAAMLFYLAVEYILRNSPLTHAIRDDDARRKIEVL
jgi:hypothetical protein